MLVFNPFSPSDTFAQNYGNYYAIVAEKDHYYDSLIQARGIENMNNSGLRPYLRWKKQWTPVMREDGNFDSVFYQMRLTQQNLNGFRSTVTNNAFAANWKELGPTKTPIGYIGTKNYIGVGRLMTLTFDPESSNTILVGSNSGGLHVSYDKGDSFTVAGTDKLPCPNGVSSIIITRKQGVKYWFIATGDRDQEFTYSNGIYRSVDDGLSWQNIGLDNIGFMKINKIVAYPADPNIMLAATTKGIYRCSNAFSSQPSWIKVQDSAFFDICYKPNPTNPLYPEIIYASREYKCTPYWSVTNAIVYSTDNGITFNELPGCAQVLPTINWGSLRVNLETTAVNGNRLYIYVSYGHFDPQLPTSESKLYIYTYDVNNPTYSFKSIVPTKADPGRQGFTASSYDENLLFVGYLWIYKSVDGGVNWTLLPDETHMDVHELVIDPNNTGLWAATDGGLSYFSFTTNTMTDKNNNLGIHISDEMDICKANTNDILIGGWDNGSILFRRNFNQWYFISEGDCWGLAIDHSAPGRYYTSNGMAFLRFEGYGNGYNGGGINVTCPYTSGINTHRITLNPLNSNWVYETASAGYGIYRSFDKGNQGGWENITDKLYDQLTGGGWSTFECFHAPSDGNVIYTKAIKSGEPDHLFRTSNANVVPGTNVEWIEIALPDMQYKSVGKIAVDDSNPYEFWMVSPQTWNHGKKVFKYSNGTWTDLTGSLYIVHYFNPSVKSIVHLAGSDGGIFVGTDAGVYYRDNTLSDWVSFSDGIPNVEVRNLLFDYTNNKLIAGTVGRGLWETSLDCIYDPVPMVITTTPAPWTTPLTIKSDIIIKSGATLSIQTKVSLSLSSKIVVERGGKLIVDGGELTSECNGLWKGVEVWGTLGELQNKFNSGWVQIINNGIISDARCAISTIRMEGATPDYSYSGGIITCNNASFRNNKTAISFYPYKNPHGNNISQFQNVQFLSDGEYKHPADLPATFINLVGVTGITFRGCTFKNLRNESDITKRGIAITAYASGFSVTHLCISPSIPCNQFKRSHFEGLYYGVRAFGDGNLYYLDVKNSDFENNLRGVYIGGINSSSVNNCIFKTIETNVSFPSYGVYFDNCYGFSVQENSFTGIAITHPLPLYQTGVIVNNSGSTNNEIYNNTFTNLTNGLTAQDDNRGLVCKCNDYTGVKTDQSVLLSNGVPTIWGISLYQGDSLINTGLAGNTFSQRSIGSGTYDLFNQGARFKYYHHPNTASKRLKPEYFNNNYTKEWSVYSYIKQTSCPSKLNSGGSGLEEMKIELLSTSTSVQQKETELQALVDGGTTEQTTEDIIYSIPPEALMLRDELLTKSPYLSDTVMQSAVANEFVLPNVMIRDILVANPQSASSESVIDELDKRIEPMPEDLYNQILDSESDYSPLEIREMELASLKAKQSWLFNSVVAHYLSDTTGTLSDSLNVVLQNAPFPEGRYLLALKQMAENDTTAAASTLQAIPSSFELSNEQQAIFNDYLSYFEILKGMNRDTLPGTETDSIQTASLLALMTNVNEPVKSYIRTILIANEVITYEEPYLYADELKTSRIRKPNTTKYEEDAVLQINPNPATDYFIVRYNLNNQISPATLEVVTMNGQVLLKKLLNKNRDQFVVPLTGFSPGIYIVSIRVRDRVLDNCKLLVVK